jgi:hypothetical protein
MKPQVMMMRLKVLDAKEKLIENIGPFPAVEIDNLILVRMSAETIRSIPKDSLTKLGEAAVERGKTFVFLPPEAEFLQVSQKWEVKK